MTLPRILVIDDRYATQLDEQRNFREDCGLAKIDAKTSDRELEERRREGAIAGAVFSPGQIRHGASVENSIEEALRAVKSGWPSPEGWRWALVLVDLRFDSTSGGGEDAEFGLKILQELVRSFPDRDARPGNSELPIVMLSTIPYAKGATPANWAGASAYVDKAELKKPKRFDELLEEHGLLSDQGGDLLGRSYALLKVLRRARAIARMPYGNALILGPQGAGKSSLARFIHEESKRRPGSNRDGHLVEYTSTPAAKELEYSNLFGCWVGAHNQAFESICGKAELAHKGTLLIDEVHVLSHDSQEELLLFGRLQNGRRSIRRLGNFPITNKVSDAIKSVRGDLDRKTGRISVDLLLLSASNEPLDDPSWRAAKGFKEPLYTRLATEYAGAPLRFPSLAERRDDIPLLFEHFLRQATKKIDGHKNADQTKSIDPGVNRRLLEYDWPGNVAELSGIAKEAARNSKGFTEVLPRHLPRFEDPPPAEEAPRPSPAPLPSPTPLPSPAPPAPVPTRRVNALAEAEESLRNAEVPRSRIELQGSLASIEQAYGQLIKEVIEEALLQENLPGRHSREVLLPVLRSLFGDKMKTAGEAYSKLLKLESLFWKHDPPATESLLAKAIVRAKKNRRPKARKSKSKSAAD